MNMVETTTINTNKRENPHPNPEENNVTKKRKITAQNPSNDNKYSNSRRLIKLYCPAVSKIADVLAWEEQRLDLGTIASTFGLGPATLKLNGHFISRGVDFVASCVTWKSLISFFSSKGLSTGDRASNALIVDGKLCKSGTKRLHEPSEVENAVPGIKGCKEGEEVCRNHCQREINSPKNKKLKNFNVSVDDHTAKCSDLAWKRKHWLENLSPTKRAKVKGGYSDSVSQGYREHGDKDSGSTNLRCGYQTSESMKRIREDEVIGATSCKRIR